MGQYWTLDLKYRVILGRKIQIRREKNFRTTPRVSTGLLVNNIDMTSPVLAGPNSTL
jgi:hypothetical protein